MSEAILVTGGAGYIGSHTCKELARQGFLPITLDNLQTGFRHNVKWGPFVEGDIRNSQLITQIIRSHKIEAVIHFAACAYVGESVVDPKKYYHNNVIGTLLLLDSLLDNGVKNIVFSSSCAVYGIPEQNPISENHSLSPVNPYGDSKLFIEKVLNSYRRSYEINFVSLRYFNAAGADPDGEIGEEHIPETHLIPLALQACMENGETLKIFGNDYPTFDGSAIRDYIHVCDLARAHIEAIKYLSKKNDSQILNLGTGTGHSVLDIVKTSEKIINKKCHFITVARRTGDPHELVAHAVKANEVLKWKPCYTNIEDIIATSWNWMTNQDKSLVPNCKNNK